MSAGPGAERQVSTELIVVRHGETHWNVEGRIQGYSADSALTPRGLAQARAVGERLGGEGIEALFSSDLGRTRQTLQPIIDATGLAAGFDVLLRERSYGEFEGRTYAEIEREFPEAWLRFKSRDPHFALPGGESLAQFQERVVAAFGSVVQQAGGRRVAVVTHGGVLGALYRHVNRLPLDAPREWSMFNASINRILVENGRWSVLRWGDVSHLPEDSLDDA